MQGTVFEKVRLEPLPRDLIVPFGWKHLAQAASAGMIHRLLSAGGIVHIKSSRCRSTKIKAFPAGNVFANPGSWTPEASAHGYSSAGETPGSFIEGSLQCSSPRVGLISTFSKLLCTEMEENKGDYIIILEERRPSKKKKKTQTSVCTEIALPQVLA